VIGADGVGCFLGSEGRDFGEAIGKDEGVGVEVEEPVAGGGMGSLLAGPSFSFPAGGHFFSGDDGGAEVAGDAGGFVGGLVVDDEDFQGVG